MFRSFFDFKNYQKLKTVTVFWVALFFFFLSFTQTSFASTYHWNQDDWIDGEDSSNFASHSLNQNNWTKYFSKDSNITADSGLVKLSYLSSLFSQDSSNFSSATMNGVHLNSLNQLQLDFGEIVSQITSGNDSTCTIKTDGTVYCWGINTFGNLGNNTTVSQKAPVQVVGVDGVGYFTGASQLSAGAYHTCAIKNGAVFCWGVNPNGQLGNNSNVNKSTPVQVLGVGASGYLTEISQIASGYNHTCAIKNGAVFCWGVNDNGQLGVNSTIKKTTPVQVLGVGASGYMTGVSRIFAGANHTCAVKSDGTTYCWGNNNYGQLGNNATTNSQTTPVQVVGVGGSGYLADVSQIAAGSSFSCFVKTDGTVYCCGSGLYGQLGLNSTSDQKTPSQVVGVGASGYLTGVSRVSAGNSHTCALKTDGTVFCWGYNESGQIGNNTTSTRQNSPVQVLGVGASGYLTGGLQIFNGFDHVCVLKADGTVFCWGRNDNGEFGDNTNTNSTTPVQTVNTFTSITTGWFNGVSQLSTGVNHACALKTGRTVFCWGNNTSGQVGNNTFLNPQKIPNPVQGVGASGFLTDVSQIGSGNTHNCAIKTDGTAYCWGSNSNGQLGINSTETKTTPVQVLGVGGSGYLTDVSRIVGGNAFNCALKTNGTVFCWGRNPDGQVGNNAAVDAQKTPVQVFGVGASGFLTDISQISTGNSHACALKSDRTIYCWGYNDSGRLGDNTTTGRRVPVQVLGVGGSGYLTDIVQIAAGNQHTCAVKTDGTVYCWGYNLFGQLGTNSTATKITPAQVVGVGGTGYLTDVSQVVTGSAHTCALKTDGTVFCWGLNDVNQLGDGYINTHRNFPAQVVSGVIGSAYLTDVAQISAGYNFTCALKTTGVTFCWGGNNYGQIGNNAIGDSAAGRYTFDPDNWQLRLNVYSSPGVLTSGILDLEKSIPSLNQLSLVQEVSDQTSVKLQFKTAETEAGLASASWFGPTGDDSYFTSDNLDVSNLSLSRYFQYHLILETVNESWTPTLSRFSFNYDAYATTGFLISSPFDSSSAENLISNISWIKNSLDHTSVKFQLRSASTQSGLSSQDWSGPDGTSTTFFTNNLGNTTPDSFKKDSNDRWFQSKLILETTDGSVSPIVYSSNITYAVNSPPEFDSAYEGSGLAVSQGNTPGTFNFIYKVRDPDTSQAMEDNRYHLWPSFQYSFDNGSTWNTIIATNLTGYSSQNPLTLTDDSTYVEGLTTWDGATELPETYSNILFRIIADDGESANNTAAVTTASSFIFDTKKPVGAAVDGGGAGININKNAVSPLALDKTNNQNVTLYFAASDDSSFQFRYGLGSSLSSIEYQDFVSSVGFTLPSGDGSKRVYVQFRDEYGNESSVYSDVIQLDTVSPNDATLFLQDISNPNKQEARVFISWPKNTAVDWNGYKVYRSLSGSDYSNLSSITNINTNYFVDTSVENGKTYTYKVTNLDDLTNESIGTTIIQAVWGNPLDFVTPTISNLQVSQKTTNSVVISWSTNEVSNSDVLYSTDTNFGSIKGDSGYVRSHTVVLTGLSSGTQYNFKVRSSDPVGNTSESEATTFTTNQADVLGPEISNISNSNISLSRSTITFTTNELASSFIEYSITSGFISGQVTGQEELVTDHSVSLRSLSSATTYYYKVRSLDAAGNLTVSDQYSFTTSAGSLDTTVPIISAVAVSDQKYNTATISFTTNEAASSFVEFGRDSNYGRIFGYDDSVTSHLLTLPYDLQPNTVYYYRVKSRDLSDNEAISVGSSFVTADDPDDLIAPIISNVVISEPKQNSITVSWQTDEHANSIIGFSQDFSYSLEQGSHTMTKNHTVTLVGLTAGTIYNFRLKSVDPSGNTAYDNNSNQGYQFSTAAGSNPPVISSNQIKNVTKSTADIYWETSINADSYVEYGLDESYGTWLGLNEAVSNHTISLSGLLSGSTYYFRTHSSFNGAEAVSSNFTLTTQGVAGTLPPTSSDSSDTTPEEATLINKIRNGTVEFIRKIISILPDTIISEDDFVSEMKSASPKIVSSPSITSSSIIVVPGVDKITISWATDKNANSAVAYSIDSDYQSTKSYASEVGNYDESTTSHSVDLINLNPSTTYHYQVKSKSAFGDWTISADFTFTTLSINSEVRDFRFTNIGQNSVTANWSTTYESRAMVEVVDILSGKTVSKTEEKSFSSDHSVTLDQLQNSTNYQLKLSHVAKDATISETAVYPFSTLASSNPPVISNVRISNALISGAVDQVQTIISWKTDKPATSRIVYNEGASDELNQSTSLDKSMVVDHIVVTTNFKTGKVYKFKVESVDASNNVSFSKDYLIKTPKPEKSVLDLIIDNLTSSFSFINGGK